MQFETRYKELIEKVLINGILKPSRAGNVRGIFGEQLKFDCLKDNIFPLLTSRKMFYEGVVGEFAAFLRSPTKLSDFEEQGCNYWKQWANADGSLDIDYGNKWFNFNGVNQVQDCISSIIANPYGRRHIITSWDPVSVPKLSLPCCHYTYQFNVSQGRLHLVWIQRSADLMIGVPSDMILASLLLLAMCKSTGHQPGEITMQFGDVHIYEPHFENTEKYLETSQLPPPNYTFEGDMFSFKPDGLQIWNYKHHPVLRYELLG